MDKPPPPERPTPSPGDRHSEVWFRVREALTAIPSYFATDLSISGLHATDIFTVNDVFGATIEDQVVDTLNRMRAAWDPDDRYALYSFVRQAQTFPDVLLARRAPDGITFEDIALGIELKGWYLLAKEGEPSFRFQVTPSACSERDLIVVVPWYLSNVISGSPRVLPPFIESARYAALYRNYWWQYIRSTTGSTEIRLPEGVGPYPSKTDQISDQPAEDSGRNFGRFARTGLMDAYLRSVEMERIAGIEARYWRAFFQLFQERHDPERVAAQLQQIRSQLTGSYGGPAETAMSLLETIGGILSEYADRQRQSGAEVEYPRPRRMRRRRSQNGATAAGRN